ncbi:MAG: ABC transporter permease [Clostridia bacterium]|nr:ABC transporter permease [Clostridia bacterium]
MRKYLSFFRIRFLSGLQYRAAAWAGVSTQFAWGGMSLLMYRAFWRAGSEAFPMEFSDLSTYIWLQQALLAMFMAWYFDNDIFDSITSGSIAYELCRPCDLYTMWFTKNVAVRLSRVVLRCFPILLVAMFLPKPYGVSLPGSVMAEVLFPLSLILGFLVLVAFSMLIYISAFYTISSTGIRILATSAVEFLTGGVIPLPFFPDWIQPIMNLLPFASMQSTPFLIYTGHVGGQDAMSAILLQAVWLVLLVGVGKLWIRRATRRVVLQGG